MDTNNIDPLTEKLVNTLSAVRDDYKSMKDTLALSIRKDIVAVQLKDILDSSCDFYSLKSNLEEYIENLYIIKNGEDKK